MLQSMTGYGRGEAGNDRWRFQVEARSVNHRFCEVVVRLPKQLSPLEDRVRKYVQERVCRGRIDVYVNAEQYADRRKTVKVDKDLALAYYSALKELQAELGLGGNVDCSLLAQLPNVFVVEEPEENLAEVWPTLLEAVSQATDELLKMREVEGARLCADLVYRIGKIGELIQEIEERAPVILGEYRRRVRERAGELVPGVALDEDRLAMEVVLFAEKSSTTEELVRLRSHLDQMREAMQSQEAAGRKLNFLIQEIHREANTVSAKAGDLLTSRAVVELKSELEKIREQIQNLE